MGHLRSHDNFNLADSRHITLDVPDGMPTLSKPVQGPDSVGLERPLKLTHLPMQDNSGIGCRYYQQCTDRCNRLMLTTKDWTGM